MIAGSVTGTFLYEVTMLHHDLYKAQRDAECIYQLAINQWSQARQHLIKAEQQMADAEQDFLARRKEWEQAIQGDRP